MGPQRSWKSCCSLSCHTHIKCPVADQFHFIWIRFDASDYGERISSISTRLGVPGAVTRSAMAALRPPFCTGQELPVSFRRAGPLVTGRQHPEWTALLSRGNSCIWRLYGFSTANDPVHWNVVGLRKNRANCGLGIADTNSQRARLQRR